MLTRIAIGLAAFLMLLMGGCTERPGPAMTVQVARGHDTAGSPAPGAGSESKEHQEPMSTEPRERKIERAMFGAGCFWGVEAAFRSTPGVVDTAVGYSGGAVENPTYKQVCTDTTGHAEVVLVTFDANETSYEDVLNVFWQNHDPTQVNRQGPDIGRQYRSVIFYFDDAQKETAERSKSALGKSGKHSRPIATEITKAGTFWKAEEYHQRYLEKRGLETCHIPGG